MLDAVWAGRGAGRRAPEVGCRQVPGGSPVGHTRSCWAPRRRHLCPQVAVFCVTCFTVSCSHSVGGNVCLLGVELLVLRRPMLRVWAWAPHRSPRSTALGSWHWGRVLPPSENLYLGKGASSYLAFWGNQFEMKSGANVKPVLTLSHGLCWLKGMASSGVQLDILERTNEWLLTVNTRGVWVTCSTWAATSIA